MKLLRVGPFGHERPAVMVGDEVLDVSAHMPDFDGAFFEGGGLVRLRNLVDDRALRPVRLPGDLRVGAPIARPGKVVCIGLNYSDHAEEAGVPPPEEPVVFLKAPGTVIGPYDDVHIPPGSAATDWEVELAVVVGQTARYLSTVDEADECIAGYAVSNDVSERTYQLERGGQWVKGKSCETFNPLGPWLVTRDEIPDAGRLSMWLDVNGQRMQDSSTDNMLFDVRYLVWYLSQFMVLEPGDLINTGTPAGVALGMKPPRYLRDGDVMELGIPGLGSQRQLCRLAPVDLTVRRTGQAPATAGEM